MSKIQAAARQAGAWWAGRLDDGHADFREAFAAAVADRVEEVMTGELAWKWESFSLPSGITCSRMVRDPRGGKERAWLRIAFDYDPDPLLEEALLESIPGLDSWDLKRTLPRKHELLIRLNEGRLEPKEGYGNWTAHIAIAETEPAR